MIKNKSNSNILYPLCVLLFLLANVMLITRESGSTAQLVAYYVVNVLICVAAVCAVTFVMKKYSVCESSITALSVTLLIEPFFVFGMFAAHDFRITAAYVLFFLMLFTLRRERLIWLSPVLLLAMMLLAPTSGLSLAPFILALMFYEAVSDKKSGNTRAEVLVVSLVLTAVIIACIFIRTDSEIINSLFRQSTTDAEMMVDFSIFKELFTKLLPWEIPMLALVVMIWKNVLQTSSKSSVTSFVVVNAVVSVLSMVFSCGRFSFTLCGVQLLLLLYLCCRGEDDVVAAVDKTYKLLANHPIIAVIAIVWCAFNKVYYVSSVCEDSYILHCLENYFMLV